MIDQIIVPSSVHLWVGTLVLVSNSILFLLTGWLAWQKKAFTSVANGVFVLFQLSLMLQALVGIKLLDQGLGILQLYIHYLGGLAPLAFCLLFYWLPTSDEYAKSRRVAILSSASLFFVLLTFTVGSIYAARTKAEASSSTGAERAVSLYTTCAGCHGASGEGVAGLGVSLTDNEFIKSHSDDELVAFIKAGRAASDPENKTGQVMPAWGGNPSLTEANLYDLVAFLRTLE